MFRLIRPKLKCSWPFSTRACFVLTESTWTEKGYVSTILTDLKWVWLCFIHARHVLTDSAEAKMYETEFDEAHYVFPDPTQTGYISTESTIAKLCLTVFDPNWLYFDQSNWTRFSSTNSTEAKYVWLWSSQVCYFLTGSTQTSFVSADLLEAKMC